MSKRHQATRRRSYGRRQHELHQRVELSGLADDWTGSPDDAFDGQAGYAAARFDRRVPDARATWSPSGELN
jgi:hypothetical protein